MKLIGTKVENGVTIQIYEPGPTKPILSARNKTSTKLSRAEIKTIQCLPEKEVSNETTR